MSLHPISHDSLFRGPRTRHGHSVPICQEPLSQPVSSLFVRPFPLWKRLVDIVGATLALIVFSPAMLVIALSIKLDSPGPVLFRQQRGGWRGKPFMLIKFRSMTVDAEARKHELVHLNERSGPAFKMTNDPRVTPVGRCLRRTSLDELPQFFNVLKGDMSLVGPRPLPVEEEEGYDQWHWQRLDMKPGITCIWQVYSRDEHDFDNWVRLDIQYIQSFSFWLDLKLMLLTIPAVLSRRGAH